APARTHAPAYIALADGGPIVIWVGPVEASGEHDSVQPVGAVRLLPTGERFLLGAFDAVWPGDIPGVAAGGEQMNWGDWRVVASDRAVYAASIPTRTGLLVFDGERSRRLGPAEGLGSNRVLDLAWLDGSLYLSL